MILRPSFTLGGSGGGIAYDKTEFDTAIRWALQQSPTHECLVEESVLGWKEYELEVIRDRADNFIVDLLDRELRPDGRAHRRLDHRRAGDDADRQGVPAPARRGARDHHRDRRRDRRLQRPVRGQPEDGRVIVIEMNPRVSRSSALASKATGYPIAKIAAKLAVGYTLDELANDITGTSAAFEPTIDYVVVKCAALRVREVPGRRPAPRHADEVRRRGDGDRPHLQARRCRRPRARSRPAATGCVTLIDRVDYRALRDALRKQRETGVAHGSRAAGCAEGVPRADRRRARRRRCSR